MPRPKKPEKPEPKTVILRVPEDWHDFLRDKAHEERTHIAELVRKALEATYGLKPPDEGKKGGTVYPMGGTPAPRFADHG